MKDILSCSELEVKSNDKSLLTFLHSIPVFKFSTDNASFYGLSWTEQPHPGGHAPLLPAMGQVSGSVGSRTGKVKGANSIGVWLSDMESTTPESDPEINTGFQPHLTPDINLLSVPFLPIK